MNEDSYLKILILSDIPWENRDTDLICSQLLKAVKFAKPDLIFFVGDIICDGFGMNKPFLREISNFMHYLDEHKITTFLISGNHDEENLKDYTKLINELKNLSCINEISDREISYKNYKILGISFNSFTKTRILPILKKYSSNYFDFVLIHSRESCLCLADNINSNLFIRGHCGTSIGQFGKNILISNDSGPFEFTILEYSSKNSYNVSQFKEFNLLRKYRFDDGNLTNTITGAKILPIKDLQLLVKCKDEFKTGNDEIKKQIIFNLIKEGASLTSICNLYNTPSLIEKYYKEYYKNLK